MSQSKDLLQGLERHREALTVYCARLLWSQEDLQDALQELMLAACRNCAQFAPGTDFRSWIFRIATLTCFNFNRRHQRNDGTTPFPLDEISGGIEQELEREYTYEEILRDPAAILGRLEDEVARACRDLTEKERAILLLKAVGSLTCSEIASVLGVPLGTAQGLLTRARMKMRERLSEYARRRGVPAAKESA